MPASLAHTAPDGSPPQTEHRLPTLKQDTAPPKFLNSRASDQEHDEECRRDGQPTSCIRQVRKGAALQDVHVENQDPNGGRGDEGGDVPSDANPPPERLTEELPKATEA